MNPRGWNVNQIENQTLLVIGDYSLALVNPRGECFKAIEKPVVAWYLGVLATLVNPRGDASKPLKSQLLRGIWEYSLRS
ncbi:MAG: hypothetical protein EB023_09965 [Flavobacteriia bacterium]|nr:hypothetical protein [Flavobacteriia bacterium]